MLLGTSYMRLVMENPFDNHPVLASAAYNAAPAGLRMARRPPAGGSHHAETIPFSETRATTSRRS